MPKFVWEITGRGQWRPQLFHGELPREMTMPHNAHRYVMHDLTSQQYADATEYPTIFPLEYLAWVFPPPPPFTGKE